MDILKELGDNKTVLLLIKDISYNGVIVDLVKQLSTKNVCYVTLNKTYNSLKESFQKNGINTENIVFIDAISKTIKKVPDQSSGCYYVSSPGALTELSLVITKFIKHGFDYLVFDSLTNLMIYEKKAPVAKFLSSIVNKIKESNTKALFYALSMKEQDDLIKEGSMFVDNVIDLSKE